MCQRFVIFSQKCKRWKRVHEFKFYEIYLNKNQINIAVKKIIFKSLLKLFSWFLSSSYFSEMVILSKLLFLSDSSIYHWSKIYLRRVSKIDSCGVRKFVRLNACFGAGFTPLNLMLHKIIQGFPVLHNVTDFVLDKKYLRIDEFKTSSQIFLYDQLKQTVWKSPAYAETFRVCSHQLF